MGESNLIYLCLIFTVIRCHYFTKCVVEAQKNHAGKTTGLEEATVSTINYEYSYEYSFENSTVDDYEYLYISNIEDFCNNYIKNNKKDINKDFAYIYECFDEEIIDNDNESYSKQYVSLDKIEKLYTSSHHKDVKGFLAQDNSKTKAKDYSLVITLTHEYLSTDMKHLKTLIDTLTHSNVTVYIFIDLNEITSLSSLSPSAVIVQVDMKAEFEYLTRNNSSDIPDMNIDMKAFTQQLGLLIGWKYRLLSDLVICMHEDFFMREDFFMPENFSENFFMHEKKQDFFFMHESLEVVMEDIFQKLRYFDMVGSYQRLEGTGTCWGIHPGFLGVRRSRVGIACIKQWLMLSVSSNDTRLLASAESLLTAIEQSRNFRFFPTQTLPSIL